MPDEALWDCDQALKIDPQSLKGLFRRSQANCTRLDRWLAKEELGEFWSLDKGTSALKAARNDWKKLALLLEESGKKPDSGVINARKRITNLEAKLSAVAKNRQSAERSLFQSKITQGIDREHADIARTPGQPLVSEEDLADMPDLED